MGPDSGPVLSGFAAWLDAGPMGGPMAARHLAVAREFLTWYDVNRQEDLAGAAKLFAEFGTAQQASSMRLLLGYLGDDPSPAG